MPDYDDENYPLTSSKELSNTRSRRSGISNKRRSELKAAISGPYAFDGGGVSTAALGDAPLWNLNGNRLLYPDSSSTVLNGLLPPKQTFARGLRRNSDIPLRQHHSSLAWSTDHPATTPAHGSLRPTHTTHKRPRKVDISRPLVLDSSHFSSSPGISRERSRRSTQINRGSRLSRTMTSSIFKEHPGEVISQGLSLSDEQARGSNLLDVPSYGSDSRTMVGSFPALDLNLITSAASFGSVKQRTRKIDKALRTSRTMLLPVPQEEKPDLVYTDDSDTFSSPPSTPSTPVWETMATSSIPNQDPKLATKLELADVHAQIQAMINSASRPFSADSVDHLAQDQGPSNTDRNDIPPSLRPSNPMYRSFPRFATTHKRSASSPPLGSGIYHAYPPDFRDRLLYRPIVPVVQNNPAPPASLPSKTMPASPTSTTPANPATPATPTKKSSSERSDSPSVYSQQSPSSQTGEVTPTSSNASSPDHPYAKSKHERLLAAISEGISSPTKPGPTAPSILVSGHAVPVIVVTDPNDDDLVYSESSFSIVDMYAGSSESLEAGLRRRTRTAISHQPRQALESATLRNSVSFYSPRRSKVFWERSSSSEDPPKRRVSTFRPGFPSSFLSMSTLHEVEVSETTSTLRDRKSFYAAVGLKRLFRSSSRGSLFGQAQAQANGTADGTGGGGGTQSGSTSLAVPSLGGGDDNSKGRWSLFKRK